ncbi:hypothetical protein O6H91_Y392200 [Diphasiastrum complanatum]|nr:hypothetical protein O6H91_Y392200 [Diphasiastrum complanatum]
MKFLAYASRTFHEQMGNQHKQVARWVEREIGGDMWEGNCGGNCEGYCEEDAKFSTMEDSITRISVFLSILSMRTWTDERVTAGSGLAGGEQLTDWLGFQIGRRPWLQTEVQDYKMLGKKARQLESTREILEII